MRIAFIASIFIFISLSGVSQSVPKLIKMAEERYENDQFEEAIEFYTKVVGRDKANHHARFRLAECYVKTLNYGEAKKEFLRLSNIPNHSYRARSIYSYANLLKRERRFDEADSLYAFLITVPDAASYLVELARKQREGCQLATRQNKVDRGFEISPMNEINSRFNDFGAVINPSNKYLVLATTRNLPGTQYENLQYEGLLPDLAAFESRGNNRWRLASTDQKFSGLNTKWPEGSGSFTKDGKTFYFSTCPVDSTSGCQIMVSYLEEGSWSKPAALNNYINETGSENKHPSISVTGDTLFFSSNRTGGNGGSDIWMSLKGLEKESWTPAINMGSIINTPENEITPYFSSAFEGLVFSSDGHVGYGGYDIYAAKGESFFEPEIYNLGDPFNSTLDDAYFSISDSVGFLSTNRSNEKILDIYGFSVNNERLFLSLLISGESLIDARLASKFKDVMSLDLVTFRVEDYAGYDLFEPIKPSKGKPKILEDDKDAEALELAFERLFFDYGSAILRPEAKAALASLSDQLNGKSIQSIDILAYTDSIGPIKANLKLSKDRGLAAKKYLFSLGVDSSKVNVFARGEIPSEGENDHWFERIFKRRVEIIVKAGQPVTFQRASPYIIRRTIPINDFAKAIGTSIDQLRAWNGEIKNILSAGETIRIMESQVSDTPVELLVGESDFSLFVNNPN